MSEEECVPILIPVSIARLIERAFDGELRIGVLFLLGAGLGTLMRDRKDGGASTPVQPTHD